MRTPRSNRRLSATATVAFALLLVGGCADDGSRGLTEPHSVTAAPSPSDAAQPSFARGNPNPGILPRHARPFGRTYEAWMVAYREWQSGVPAATSPVLDQTGEFCGEEQSGKVWFLASLLLGPGTAERECAVPAGKALYVPLIGFIAWAPDDVGPASGVVATQLGLDPSTLTDEEIIRLTVNWFMDHVDVLELTIDGVAYRDLFSYRAETPAFDLVDSDVYDDLQIPVSHPNQAIADAYAVILPPLKAGEHTIEILAEANNPLLGPAVFDVTYHLTVGR